MAKKHIENCPFFGGPGEIKKFTGMFQHGWVGCVRCGIYKNWSVDPQGAIDKWNRRVNDD